MRGLLDSLANCLVYPLDEVVLDLMPTGLEIHDAAIVAAALLQQHDTVEAVCVVTRDRQINASGLVDVLW